jgi:hypothetical protein
MLLYTWKNWTENRETFIVELQTSIAILRTSTRAEMRPLTGVTEQNHVSEVDKHLIMCWTRTFINQLLRLVTWFMFTPSHC